MLITIVACAMQVAVAQPPLPVLNGDKRKQVPVVAHPDGGAAMRADLLIDALGGQFLADGGAKYHLQVGATRIDLEVGSAFVRLDADTLPLSAPSYRLTGRVYVPFSLASELLPRVMNGLIYDVDKRELRRFGDVSARRSAPQPSAPVTAPVRDLPSREVTPERTPTPRAPVTRNDGARRRIVVVDAGHGGVDRGMSGPIGAAQKVYEKDITLAVAKQLKVSLEQRGITVVMTRTRDTLIALGDRGKIANQAKGDLFLSIHVNAANPRWQQPGGARGFETYFLAEAKTEDARRVEAMENEVIKFETAADVSSDDPLGFIMRDMAQNEHLRESSRLADLVQQGIRRVHPGPSRGVKQAGFMVLVKAFMPAVLIEIGFGSNRAESQYMTSTENQRALAESIAASTEAFLSQYERKIGGHH